MSGNSSGDPMAAIAQVGNIQAQTPPWMKSVLRRRCCRRRCRADRGACGTTGAGFCGAGPAADREGAGGLSQGPEQHVRSGPEHEVRHRTGADDETGAQADRGAQADGPVDAGDDGRRLDQAGVDDEPGAADRYAAHAASGEALMGAGCAVRGSSQANSSILSPCFQTKP